MSTRGASAAPGPETPLTGLRGVGPKRAERLARLGLATVEDLLRHAPRAYEERGGPVPLESVASLPPGAFAVVRGRVRSRRLWRSGRGRSTLRARLESAGGSLEALWFNAPFLAEELVPGAEVALAGRVSRDGRLLQPELARLGPGEAVPERLRGIRPVYPLTEGIGQRFLRELVEQALPAASRLADPLPREIREAAALPPIADAVRWAHRPRSLAEAGAGRERLLFDELLPLELAVRRRARERHRRPAPRPGPGRGGAEAFVRALPFALSPSQGEVVAQIVRDLGAPHPMARMLAGEVGSGKTVVALAAIEEARSRGLQCALLAPTDLLARQHHRSACSLLPRGGRGVELLTASCGAAAARRARERLAAGGSDLVVGTHALLSDRTRFRRLGLVVIDEQHRFGVEQRAALLTKARTPHCLVMTATPIPRTLALLAFGDCDLSTLELRPGARGRVTTRLVPPAARARELARVREGIEAGGQAFFVRPRIEGEAAGAGELFEELAAGPLAGVPIALVHGRMPAAQREERLEAFRAGKVAALVATTLVEVGIDVPGATMLWVEGAERLGLATLHQLRGRIARRGQRGYCWVVPGADAPEGSRERLGVLVAVDDGMRLAEIDLALRGPGELLGRRQSGRLERFAGLGPNAPARLADLAERARCAAEALLDAGEEGGCPRVRQDRSVSSSSR